MSVNPLTCITPSANVGGCAGHYLITDEDFQQILTRWQRHERESTVCGRRRRPADLLGAVPVDPKDPCELNRLGRQRLFILILRHSTDLAPVLLQAASWPERVSSTGGPRQKA